jgi:hypothetical protein
VVTFLALVVVELKAVVKLARAVVEDLLAAVG